MFLSLVYMDWPIDEKGRLLLVIQVGEAVATLSLKSGQGIIGVTKTGSMCLLCADSEGTAAASTLALPQHTSTLSPENMTSNLFPPLFDQEDAPYDDVVLTKIEDQMASNSTMSETEVLLERQKQQALYEVMLREKQVGLRGDEGERETNT